MDKLSDQSLYFITLQHCNSLLKEEIQARYPSWKFNFGHHNFLCYETDRTRDFEEIHDLPLILKIGAGKLLYAGDEAGLEEAVEKARLDYDIVSTHFWDLVEEEGKMGDRKVRGLVLDIIHYNDQQFSLGLRLQVRGDFAPYKGSSPIPCPDIKMKHGYQKMGEAFKHFRPHVGHEEVFLDIGCAPGGAAYYLLEHGYRVIGVDINDVDNELRDTFKEGFLHLKQPADEINVKHLKGLPPIDWVVSDLDLSWGDVVPFLSKLISKLDDCLGLFFHIRMDDHFSFSDLEKIENEIKDAGYSEMRFGLLPSHSKEFCLFAKKDD
ncbi:MAG: hypothetical protein CME63_17240 [Halobacteriovoraceae bacterium]|nr:hypothetical protein [Halobacteriovoraceae bacterium]|tara:strand:+ start:217713 stop:218678 length:966 start_codon:yes stop_codon:yes gene_type:complete